MMCLSNGHVNQSCSSGHSYIEQRSKTFASCVAAITGHHEVNANCKILGTKER